jgi:hypothetical protein
MELWNDILAAAVLGVERRPFEIPRSDGALGALLARLDPADREGALLAAAGAVALYRRAGRRAQPAHAPAAPACPSDERAACSARAAQRLATLLEGNHRALLPEWLAALDVRGRRVAEAMLPDLLELGRAQPDLRTAILPALGARGRWLAAQNPDWSYASSEFTVVCAELDEEQLKTEWETGSRAARLTLLREVRNVAPALARELVAATWAGEKADDRAAFLETYEAGLSMDDEPFLEGALDDRSKEVRRAAAALLARLPAARLAVRMFERMQPLLVWAGGEKPRMLGLRPGQPARIDVTLPGVCDKAMIRDGVEPKPPRGRNFGERVWWVVQMLACVPPSHWSQAWRRSPAEIVAATIASEWWNELLVAWVNAARNHADSDWAEALLSAWAYPSPNFNPAALTEFVELLLEVLPHERREAFVIAYMQTNSVAIRVDSIIPMLRACGPRWSDELSRVVLDQLRRMTQEQKTFTWNIHAGFQEFALYMAPGLIQEAAENWPPDGQAWWQAAVDRFLILLQFRRDMLEELRET